MRDFVFTVLSFSNPTPDKARINHATKSMKCDQIFTRFLCDGQSFKPLVSVYPKVKNKCFYDDLLNWSLRHYSRENLKKENVSCLLPYFSWHPISDTEQTDARFTHSPASK